MAKDPRLKTVFQRTYAAGLRALLRDKQATPRQRLEAAKLLLEFETVVLPEGKFAPGRPSKFEARRRVAAAEQRKQFQAEEAARVAADRAVMQELSDAEAQADRAEWLKLLHPDSDTPTT